MDFVEWVMSLATRRGAWSWVCVLGILVGLCTQGCSDQMPAPKVGQYDEFTQAGPTGPGVDTSRLVDARLDTGPHRVAPGEVLELNMPAILRVVAAGQPSQGDGAATNPFVCRVSPKGTLVLPLVG